MELKLSQTRIIEGRTKQFFWWVKETCCTQGKYPSAWMLMQNRGSAEPCHSVQGWRNSRLCCGFQQKGFLFCVGIWASPGIFFVKCLLWFSWLQHILTWKNQQFDTPRSGHKAVQKPYGRKPAIYIYIGKDRMVTERNLWGVEWSCSCVIVGFICIELHQIMQINCVYKHFLSMAEVDISHFQKGV